MRIRVGTRGSQLARGQTGAIMAGLRDLGHDPVEVIVETRGDRDRSSAFPEFGGPGVFVREIELALLEEEIDLAVHSYKDLPSTGPPELAVAAVPTRQDPADVLLVRRGSLEPDRELLPLAEGARVGTGSARRRALLEAARSDLEVAPLRGNVDTRMRKLADGDYDAIVLAAAGLRRLEGVDDGGHPRPPGLREHRLEPSWFVPAPAQGALALQVRGADAELADALSPIHRQEVAAPISAERRLLARVEGSCSLPFGAWCRAVDDGYELFCVLGDDGRLVRGRLVGEDPEALADRAWEHLAKSGMPVR